MSLNSSGLVWAPHPPLVQIRRRFLSENKLLMYLLSQTTGISVVLKHLMNQTVKNKRQRTKALKTFNSFLEFPKRNFLY